MKILNKKQKANATVIGHGYLTATGGNWDAQLLVHKESVYFYNQRDHVLRFWDNEEFEINNKPSYMYTEKELIAIAKDM